MMLTTILNKISESTPPLLIAIDGRCAAGKTTLALMLQEAYQQKCNVIHADHFFLRPGQRTSERMNEPGGNIDYERLAGEVLEPLNKGLSFSYRRFDCQKQEMAETVHVKPAQLNIIEGSYTCHPKLFDYYNLRVFLTVNPDEQMRRIETRNGKADAQVFRDKWIPLEERYFAAYDIQDRCDICL